MLLQLPTRDEIRQEWKALMALIESGRFPLEIVEMGIPDVPGAELLCPVTSGNIIPMLEGYIRFCRETFDQFFDESKTDDSGELQEDLQRLQATIGILEHEKIQMISAQCVELACARIYAKLYKTSPDEALQLLDEIRSLRKPEKLPGLGR